MIATGGETHARAHVKRQSPASLHSSVSACRATRTRGQSGEGGVLLFIKIITRNYARQAVRCARKSKARFARLERERSDDSVRFSAPDYEERGVLPLFCLSLSVSISVSSLVTSSFRRARVRAALSNSRKLHFRAARPHRFRRPRVIASRVENLPEFARLAPPSPGRV